MLVMENKINHKEELKSLRQQRATSIDHARELIKTSNNLFKKIKSQIQDQAMTIPQISQAIEEPSSTVLVYVAGLKKFGMVVEKQKDGEYFKYQLSSTE